MELSADIQREIQQQFKNSYAQLLADITRIAEITAYAEKAMYADKQKFYDNFPQMRR